MEPARILAYVHVPKTAGTTVLDVLRRSFGARHCDAITQSADGVFSAEELAFARRIFPGLRSVGGHALVCPTERLGAGVACFTFLREPLARSASFFQEVQRSPVRASKWWKGGPQPLKRPRDVPAERYRRPTLEEHLADERFRDAQTRAIAGVPDVERALAELERYVAVGITERLDASLEILRRVSPWPLVEGHRALRVARDDSLKRRLLDDPGTRRLIADANRLDAELYERVRELGWPRRALAREPDRRAPLPDDAAARLRRRLGRMYNTGVYRQALKARRLLVR